MDRRLLLVLLALVFLLDGVAHAQDGRSAAPRFGPDVVAREKPIAQPERRPPQPSQSPQPQGAGQPRPPAQSPGSPPPDRYGAPSPPADAIDRVLGRKLTPEAIGELSRKLDALGASPGAGWGAPNADRWFDQTQRGHGADTVVRPRRDTIFQGASPQVQAPPPVVVPALRPVTRDSAQSIQKEYGHVPGGVVLEGAGSGFGQIGRVQYDGRLNAIMLDDRAAYFAPVSARSVAVLARAIAQDHRIGVSLGEMHLVYGALPPDSEVAMDLKLADKFLGDIVFARREWIAGYNLAQRYEPYPEPGTANLAVFFNFNGFDFRVVDEEMQLARVNFDVRLIPLAAAKSAEGGHMADLDAIGGGRRFPNYEQNARHLIDNVAYYRREKIIQQAFAYGEVAAFLRGLKASKVDLLRVARAIESATGIAAVAASASPSVSEMRQPIDNLFEAWRRLNVSIYLAQWAPDAVKYDRQKRSTFAELRQSRERLFPQIETVAVNYVPIYRGFRNGVGHFDSSYALSMRFRSGRPFSETACESYKVVKRGGRWVIIENRDYVPCDQIDQSLRVEYQERERRMEDDWAEYLKQIQANSHYANWAGPPHDLYRQRKGR